MAPRKKDTPDPKILRYPDSAMRSAIDAVRGGRFKIREASRYYGVPHSTLINKLKGRVPEVRKMGRDTYLTKSEEQLIKNYIIAKAKRGIHIKRATLLDTVQKIIEEDKRVTPFKNHRPGRKWIDLFYKRNPEITERKGEAISTARANVTAQDLKDWHNTLKEYLAQKNCLDILEDPQRIYNADESGFKTCPESGKVLGPVGMKNFYEIKSGKEKEQLTVMVNINAAGQTVPPMIVYPLMRISKEISNNVPEHWAIGKSKSGWMTGPLYFEYIANIFDPWLKENDIKKPVLLLIDGHRSHMTLQVSQYCKENGIIAYGLFPNSTHICQPADVSVFKCLKSGWTKTVHEYKQSTGNRQIGRAGFAPLLAKVFKEKVTEEVVKNGFKKCGLYPFDVSAVDFTKCMDHETRKTGPVVQTTLETEVGVEFLLLIESFMRHGRVAQFREVANGEEWIGDESAKELFYVWRKLRQRCMSNAATIPQDAVTNSTATSPSILPKSRGLEGQIFDEHYSLHSPQLSTSLTQKEDIRDVQSQITAVSSIQIDFHSLEPDTPPLQKDPDISTVESRTPTKFHSPIATPTLHLESPVISGSNVSESSSDKLVQLIAQKQKDISPAFGKHIIWPSDSPLKKKTKERLPFATTSKKWQDYWLSKEKEKEEKVKKAENRKRIREEKRSKKINELREPKKRIKKIISRKSDSEEEIPTKNKRQVISRKNLSETSGSDSDTAHEDKHDKVDNQKRILRKLLKRRIMSSDSSDLDETHREKRDLSTNRNSFNEGDFVIFFYEGSYFVGRIESLSAEGALIKSMQKSLNNWKWPEKEDLNLYRYSDIKETIEEPRVVNLKRGTFYVEEFKNYCDFI